MSFSDSLISIVAPFYNEEGNVSYFTERVIQVMRPLNLRFELLLVDDGSRDRTWEAILEASLTYSEVVGIKLSRNFGHQGALLAGLNEAGGDAIISMDGDLQHPPEVIPSFIEEWKAGADIVLSRRIDEEQTSLFKRATSRYFYSLFSAIADSAIDPGSSDFRLLARKPLDELLKLRYGVPFLRGAVNTLGFSVASVDYVVGERFSGTSKYSLAKMLRFARHGLVSHSPVPLRAGIYLGLATGFMSLVELLYVLVQAFRGQTVPGWASTLGILSLLFSVLFVILGIIGLYLEDIHRILKQTPHYITSTIVGRK